MTRRSIEQRIAQLDAKKKTLQARLGKQERARDTRRKVLLGALVLQRLETETQGTTPGWMRSWLMLELPKFLTRDVDKLLLEDLMGAATNSSPQTISASTPPAIPAPSFAASAQTQIGLQAPEPMPTSPAVPLV
jgi:hypothetical protein